MFALQDLQVGGQETKLFVHFIGDLGLQYRESPLERRSALITQGADFYLACEEDRQR